MLGFTPPAGEVMTGSDGVFVLRDPMTGSYTVRARASAGVEAIQDVIAGQEDLRLVLPATGTIEGRLVGFGDKARVSASRVGFDRFSARVDGDRFTIAGMPPGDYLVSARDGARSDESSVDVEPGKTASVTLTSKGTATVWGRVVNLATREPLEGIECEASLAVSGNARAVTGSAGQFRLDVPAGRMLGVRCAGTVGTGRAFGTGEVEAAAGTSRDVLIEAVVTRVHWRDRGDLGLMIRPGPPAVISKVTPGGPAERAGAKVGDAILKVDGAAVDRLESAQVRSLMEDHAAGEKANLVLRRDGREIALSIVLAAGKPD